MLKKISNFVRFQEESGARTIELYRLMLPKLTQNNQQQYKQRG